MLELPRSTAFGKIIPKDKLYKNGGASRELQNIFARQVKRIRWVNKISPDTVNISKGETVAEIEVIEVVQAFDILDHRILPFIVKTIPYHLLFILIYGEKTVYAVQYNGTIYKSSVPPKLLGGSTDMVWENFVRQIAGFAHDGIPLREQAEADGRRKKLIKQIASLEKKTRNERQPRRKWEYAEKLKWLKAELEEL